MEGAEKKSEEKGKRQCFLSVEAWMEGEELRDLLF
jgi:hypothetical protein